MTMPSRAPESFKLVAGEKSTRELSRLYNQTEDVIRRWRSQEGIKAPGPATRTFTHPRVVIDRFIMTSDWHIPYHSDEKVKQVLQAAKDHGITDVVAAGDVIDLPTLSHYDPRDIDSYLGMEFTAVGDVLYQFGEAGLRLHWSRGNHELRYFRALKHQVDIKDLVKSCIGDAQFIESYNVEELIVVSGSEQWLITHPSEYSTIQLTIPRKLAEKYHMNIASAHGHMYAMGHSPGGQKLLETGGLFDPEKIAYLWRGGATKFPLQQNGFWIIDNGKVVLP